MYVVGLMQLNEFWMNLLSTVRVDTRGKVPCDGLCHSCKFHVFVGSRAIFICSLLYRCTASSIRNRMIRKRSTALDE